jgi:hypothetical protein
MYMANEWIKETYRFDINKITCNSDSVKETTAFLFVINYRFRFVLYDLLQRNKQQ